MVKQTDYFGLVSGRNFNNATLFKTFYGKLKTAPKIEECFTIGAALNVLVLNFIIIPD